MDKVKGSRVGKGGSHKPSFKTMSVEELLVKANAENADAARIRNEAGRILGLRVDRKKAAINAHEEAIKRERDELKQARDELRVAQELQARVSSMSGTELRAINASMVAGEGPGIPAA